MSHLWWDDVPQGTPEEERLREERRAEELTTFEPPDPPRTWQRWIPPVTTTLSVALVGGLAILLAFATAGSSEGGRQGLLAVYVQIAWITLILGVINVWLWRRR